MELIFVRHGTTQGNLERRFVGSMDVPLIPQGEELARQIAPSLPEVEHIYRSPLLRCDQSAQLLWPGLAHTVIPNLRETNFGPFEGKCHDELLDDPLYVAWVNQSDPPNYSALPVGESPEAVAERVLLALHQLVADCKEKGYERVAVVSHGGTMMGLLSQIGRPERAYYGWMCKNCSGFRMAVEEDARGDITLHLLEEVGERP